MYPADAILNNIIPKKKPITTIAPIEIYKTIESLTNLCNIKPHISWDSKPPTTNPRKNEVTYYCNNRINKYPKNCNSH